MSLAKFDGVGRAKSHAPTHRIKPYTLMFFVESGNVRPLLVFFSRTRDPDSTRNT